MRTAFVGDLRSRCLGRTKGMHDFLLVEDIKIWSVSTRLSEHLIAIRHLNKLETASISRYEQNKSNI